MAYLGNTPPQEVVLQLEARKSFALGLWIMDADGRPLDITGGTLSFVVRKNEEDPSALLSAVAELTDPEIGYARLNLQASDLDFATGEYPYSLVLISDGYSAVILRGTLVLRANTDFDSVSSSYAPGELATALQIQLSGQRSIAVRTGSVVVPGTTSFTDGDKAKLDSIATGAQVNVPANWEAITAEEGAIANKPALGSAAYVDIEEIAVPLDGAPGEILTKTLSGFEWATVPNAAPGGALSATGVPVGQVPTANGVGTWSWEDLPPSGVITVNGMGGNVTIDLDTVPDSAARLAFTPAERTKLAGLTATPAYADITGKPTLGTAAAQNIEAFLPSTGIAGSLIISGSIAAARLPKVSALTGFSSGTAAPSGGADGDIYFQYS